MTTDPDPKVVREIARTAVLMAIGRARDTSVNEATFNLALHAISEESFMAYRDAVSAEYDRLSAGLSWPDENKTDAWDLFGDVAGITAWLDESNPAGPHEDSMRVLKLVEEAGEAAAAYIGLTGQNPRKGVTHSKDDLLKELADVAITALCAMQHFTQDEAETRACMAAKIAQIIARSGIRVRAGA